MNKLRTKLSILQDMLDDLKQEIEFEFSKNKSDNLKRMMLRINKIRTILFDILKRI